LRDGRKVEGWVAKLDGWWKSRGMGDEVKKGWVAKLGMR
jgi:hypothetical protein